MGKKSKKRQNKEEQEEDDLEVVPLEQALQEMQQEENPLQDDFVDESGNTEKSTELDLDEYDEEEIREIKKAKKIQKFEKKSFAEAFTSIFGNSQIPNDVRSQNLFYICRHLYYHFANKRNKQKNELQKRKKKKNKRKY
jgi:hypothetical protein